MHYNNYNMKTLNNFKSFVSNPSYLGADRLWVAGSDELVGDYHGLKDYDGI